MEKTIEMLTVPIGVRELFVVQPLRVHAQSVYVIVRKARQCQSPKSYFTVYLRRYFALLDTERHKRLGQAR